MRTWIVGAVALFSILVPATPPRGGAIATQSETVSPSVTVESMSAANNPFATPDSAGPTGMDDGAVTAKVWTVVFGGSAHNVYPDRPPYLPYPRTWRDQNLDGDARDFPGEDRDPICYTVNAEVKIQSVSIVVSPANAFDPADASIVGSVAGVDVFHGTGLSAQPLAIGWVVSKSNLQGQLTAPATIDLWQPKNISWRIEVADPAGGDPISYPAGVSDHDIHFVLQSPTGAFPLYYTLIDIACRRAAGRTLSEVNGIASDIFQEFATRTVYRAQDINEGVANPQPLKYYSDWLTTHDTLQELLEESDAQCAAWAELFIRCIHAVGVDPPNEYVMFEYDIPPQITGAQATMLVVDWAFQAQSNLDPGTSQEYPHLDLPVVPFSMQTFLANSYYHFRFEDVSDVMGVAGQAVANPASLFNWHGVVHVGETLYDPSYGTSYGAGGGAGNAMLSGIDAALAGFGLLFFQGGGLGVNEMWVGIDLDGNGQVEDVVERVPAYVWKPNPSGNQLRHFGSSPVNVVR